MNTPKNTPLLYRSILGSPPEPAKPPETQDRPKPSKSVRQWIKEGLSVVDKPTKKNKPKGKPINRYDRLNALARIPGVQRELESIGKEVDKKKKSELWSGFVKNYKVFPEELKHPESFHKYKNYPDFNTVHVFNNFEKSDLDSISKYRDGKHIIIAVDITKKDKDIKRDFEQTLKRIRKDYKIPKTRDRDFQQDIWEIYDRCFKYKTRPNYTKIARALSGKTGQARDNSQLKACLKAVKRANKRAIEIIGQVTKKCTCKI